MSELLVYQGLRCLSSVCLSIFSNHFFSEITWTIWVKFHMETNNFFKNWPWLTLTYFTPRSNPFCDRGTKACSNIPSEMMAVMTIYGNNPATFFFSGINRPIALNLGKWLYGLGPIVVCSNDDPLFAFTYFLTGKIWSFMFLYGKRLLATGLIEAKLHMEALWYRETNIYSNCLGHMTKVAVMTMIIQILS